MTCIYIYIYIERERDRERERDMYICIYIYIYTYTHTARCQQPLLSMFLCTFVHWWYHKQYHRHWRNGALRSQSICGESCALLLSWLDWDIARLLASLPFGYWYKLIVLLLWYHWYYYNNNNNNNNNKRKSSYIT